MGRSSRIQAGILALVLTIPAFAFGHTEIFFPRFFSADELANTGFAFLNPDGAATATFVLFSSSGTPLSSLPNVSIGAGQQFARLGSELFPGAPETGGWVWAFTDTEGMQAFWLNYDAGITFLDGAAAAGYETMGSDQIIPLVAGQTELTVINPNYGLKVTTTIRLFGNGGQLGPPVNREVAGGGGIQAQASDLFPAADMTEARYIRIQTTGAQVASSATIRNFIVPSDSAVINGVNVTSRSDLNFPHVISGVLPGANYTTVIGVTNLAASAQTVTINFKPDGEDAIEVSRTILANGSLRETAETLFGLTPNFRNGWVSVNGTRALTGFAAYADSVSGGLAVVPAGLAHTDLFFSHIADGPPQWQTGMAFLNAGATPATIEIYAMDASGSLLGSAVTTLDPGTKIAKVIHELIPQTLGVNAGFVYVRSTNRVPIYGIELFYTRDLKVLSNVAAGGLVSGIIYTPP